MSTVRRRSLLLLVLPFLVALPLTFTLAHDMWVVPPGKAKAKAPVTMALAVGMDFPHSTSAISADRMKLGLIGPDGKPSPAKIEVLRDEEKKLTSARFTPDRAGAWMLTAETRPNFIEMDARRFNGYLLHDGLAHVFEARYRAQEDLEDGRERYAKYVKGLVAVEGGDGRAATRPVGQILEIVPERDPLAARLGETLAVRVLFRGKPLADANLCWDVPGNGAKFLGQTWTDEKGRALVPIARTGLTSLRLIHMTRPRTDDYEWESFWASFTWRVRD